MLLKRFCLFQTAKLHKKNSNMNIFFIIFLDESIIIVNFAR